MAEGQGGKQGRVRQAVGAMGSATSDTAPEQTTTAALGTAAGTTLGISAGAILGVSLGWTLGFLTGVMLGLRRGERAGMQVTRKSKT